MVRVPVVVPAVGLARQLEVASGRAAIFAVPSPLVDGESVAPALVGQVMHAAPDPDRAGRRELDEMIKAVGVGSRVAWVGLHFAVGAFEPVMVVPHLVVSLHFLVVLEHLFEARFFVTATRVTAPFCVVRRPLFRELRHVWFDRFLFFFPSEHTARQQGQGRCKVSHLISDHKNLNY